MSWLLIMFVYEVNASGLVTANFKSEKLCHEAVEEFKAKKEDSIEMEFSCIRVKEMR